MITRDNAAPSELWVDEASAKTASRDYRSAGVGLLDEVFVFQAACVSTTSKLPVSIPPLPPHAADGFVLSNMAACSPVTAEITTMFMTTGR